MASVNRGKAVNAKSTHLARLEARRIKEPFVELREPRIKLPVLKAVEAEDGYEAASILKVENYQLDFEEKILKDVSFEIGPHEKVAIVGPNGTGKTTLLREIFHNRNEAIQISPDAKIGFVSQTHSEVLNESNTVFEEFEQLGFERRAEMQKYLKKYSKPYINYSF